MAKLLSVFGKYIDLLKSRALWLLLKNSSTHQQILDIDYSHSNIVGFPQLLYCTFGALYKIQLC